MVAQRKQGPVDSGAWINAVTLHAEPTSHVGALRLGLMPAKKYGTPAELRKAKHDQSSSLQAMTVIEARCPPLRPGVPALVAEVGP
jgi:hypothetical protein